MHVSVRVLGLVAYAVLAVCLFAMAPVKAISSGQLGNCDLTPVVDGGVTWPNGCLGYNTWSKPYLVTCKGNNDMRWAASPRPTPDFTIRSGDVGTNDTDVRSYIPGGALNEIHLRTLKLDKRVIGFLMYATNGTNPVTKKERQVGSWRVVPTVSAGYQVSPTCFNTAVTHSGAEVKPTHGRFWFSAPVGTGTVRFRVLVKEGVQGRGNFWFPVQELVLTEGAAPVPPPQNVPAVVGMVQVNGSMVEGIVTPAIIVPIAPTDREEKVPVLSELGQNCAEACAEQLPAMPFCHRKATVGISSSDALLSAIGSQVDCALPIVAGCPYSGAAHVTRNATGRNTCSFRSQDAGLSCPSWALGTTSSIVSAASQFVSGTTSITDRSSTSYVPDVCFTQPTKDSQNVCMCTNIEAQQGSNPFTVAAIAAAKAGGKKSRAQGKISESTSAAAGRTSSVTSGLLLAVLSAVFGVSSSRMGGSKLALLVVAVVALLSLSSSPVSAHNYLRGLHRATEASVTLPCQTKIGNDPHVQIVAGQTFEMEFTNGHGVNEGQRKHYFAIVPASAYDQLKAKNITDIFRAYLNQAPPSAFRKNQPNPRMWERQHRRQVGQYGGQALHWEDPKGINATDPLLIVVDPIMNEKTHPGPYAPNAKMIHTFVNKALFDTYGYDRRAVYKNTNWTWIESVDEFINPYNRDGSEGSADFFSHQGDIARFNFPASHGVGDYIAYYSWSGYGDCIDINVRPGTTPVKYRYGRNATELGGKSYAIKVDHCEIRNIPSARTMMRIIDPVTHDASQCIDECLALGWNQCSAVQVVRNKNPEGTLDWPPNVPWIPYHWNQTDWDRVGSGRDWPCSCDNVAECLSRGCRRTSVEQAKQEGWSLGGQDQINALNLANANSDINNYPNLKPEDYFCFGVKPGRNQDNQVDEDWVIADDPADPVWYSSCYLTATSGGFLDIPPLQMTPIDYTTSERCVSCDWYEQASAFRLQQSPMWDRGLQNADKCADCTLVASAPPAASRAAQLDALVGADVAFSGYNAKAEKAEYLAAVAAADAGGNGDAPAESSPSGSSDTLLFGLKKLPSVLVIVAFGLGGLLIGAGVVFAVVSLRNKRRSSNSDLRRMQESGGFPSTELSPNPAAFARL